MKSVPCLGLSASRRALVVALCVEPGYFVPGLRRGVFFVGVEAAFFLQEVAFNYLYRFCR